MQIEIKNTCLLNHAVYWLAFLLRTVEVLVSNLSFLTVQADVFCGIPQSPLTFLGYNNKISFSVIQVLFVVYEANKQSNNNSFNQQCALFTSHPVDVFMF